MKCYQCLNFIDNKGYGIFGWCFIMQDNVFRDSEVCAFFIYDEGLFEQGDYDGDYDDG